MSNSVSSETSYDASETRIPSAYIPKQERESITSQKGITSGSYNDDIFSNSSQTSSSRNNQATPDGSRLSASSSFSHNSRLPGDRSTGNELEEAYTQKQREEDDFVKRRERRQNRRIGKGCQMFTFKNSEVRVCFSKLIKFLKNPDIFAVYPILSAILFFNP